MEGGDALRNEARIFNVVAAGMFSFAAGYAIWHRLAYGRIDWVGVIMLGMGGILCAMGGLYFWLVSRRIDPRPEDRPDAELAEGAGEMGFFSPGSYWPIGLAAAAAVAGLGVVFWWAWLLVGGIVLVLVTTAGLVLEYYTGARRAREAATATSPVPPHRPANP